MPDPTPTNDHAERWRTLLDENRALQNDLDLVASFRKPLSHQQIAQLEISATRLENLSKKVRELVDEWAVKQDSGPDGRYAQLTENTHGRTQK
jgi:hypothetical protein